MFISFYVGSISYKKKREKDVAIFIFIFISLFFRILIPFEENADYYPYAFLRTYEFDISKPLNDPILKLVFNIYEVIFFGSRELAIKGLYWTNFIICNMFFIFLMRIKNLMLFKKVLFFVLYYFLFSYVLLRNGIGYILVALFYFYYLNSCFLNKRIKYLWAAIFFHFSAIPILVVNLLVNITFKQAILGLLFSIVITILIFIGLDINIDVVLDKLSKYSNSNRQEGLFHKIWFYFMWILFLMSFLENTKLAKNRIGVLIFTIYLVAYSIQHVAGFRFSVYYIMYYLLINPNTKFYIKYKKVLNFSSLIFLAYFIFSFIDTHNK